jgi:uncharacterized lipoprotein YddW (UPF0748 family)
MSRSKLFKENKVLLSLLLMLSLSSSVLYCEVRALWVMPWNITNKEQIDEMLFDAYENNQTEVLAEVRYRADAMYIPNKYNSVFNNPDPRSSILKNTSFDPLDYMIEKAHSYGIQVQAWIVVLNSVQTNKDLASTNHIYKNHSDWIMTDTYGNRMNASNYMGYFIDPGIPEVKNYLINVMLDIVSNYPDLDGIHLDYIRYPAKHLGYSKISVNRFQEFKTTNNIEWNDWRILQLTNLIKEFRDLALAINPNLAITAAVMADAQEAKIHYAQDWISWINNGILDRVYPMAYAKEYNNFHRVVSYYSDLLPQEKIVIGLRAWQESPKQYYDVSRIIEKANLSRQFGFGGIALFSYEGVKKSGFFPKLFAALYKDRVTSMNDSAEDKFISMITQSYHTGSDSTTTQMIVPNSNCDINAQDSLETSKLDYTLSFCENIAVSENEIKFTFYFAKTDRWIWKVLDANDIEIFSENKIYTRGMVLDEWNGIIHDSNRISSGIYTLKLYSSQKVLVHEKRFVIN